jgi:hypothetical protein
VQITCMAEGDGHESSLWTPSCREEWASWKDMAAHCSRTTKPHTLSRLAKCWKLWWTRFRVRVWPGVVQKRNCLKCIWMAFYGHARPGGRGSGSGRPVFRMIKNYMSPPHLQW